MAAPRVRRYDTADLAAYVATHNAADPRHPLTPEEAQRRDDTWDGTRYHLARYVAEDQAGDLVGWGQMAHTPWQFDPGRYELRLEVTPARRRRGVGGALFRTLLDEVRARDGGVVRAAATEEDGDSVGFLTRRGFRDVWRYIGAHLDVGTFDAAPFAAALEQARQNGVTITTLAEELARDPRVVREVYDVYIATSRGTQELDPVTPPGFDDFVTDQIETPSTIPEAWFLARLGDQLVGLSSLERVPGATDALEVGYTAVVPEYRGRRIAMALKLRTIEYAREHGYRTIRTGTNAGNEAMLRVNRALGFEPEPALVTFELHLRVDTP